MAQNYTRQSSMADGDTITAALFNNEYNQLVNAFAYSSSSASSTGHRHDGSSGQGGNIPQIGDLDFLNKVVVDGTNNRVGFFVEVSSSAVEQVRIQDGAIVPVTDNDIDLGTSSLEFKDGYFDGTVYADAINFNGTAITSTAAELNILDGVTSTAAEINLLDGVTATTTELNYNDTGASVGTVVASKVVTVDANKDVASFRNITLTGELDAGSLDISGDADIDGTLETDALSINGTAVTSTAAELNILDGATVVVGEINALDLGSTAVGTAIASKAVILDSSKDYTGIRNLTITGELDAATLDISGDVDVDGTLETDALSINGTAVTSTAVELNILDGVTSTAAELNTLDGITAVVGELNALDLGSTAVGNAIASKAVILDSNKDYTGIRNFTITGELDAGSLDISGDIDVDGTTNLDVVDIDGAVDFASTTAHAGNATFADNAKAIFGAGSDLQIYHDATDSYISDQGSGNLKLLTDEFRLRNAADGAHMLTGSQGGAITAYHNGSAKLATTSTGIDVTGTVTATGTSVFASLDISGDIDVDGTTNLDVVDVDGAVDMASTLAVAGVVTANAGVVVDNITIDGTEIDLSSGDLTIDVAGDIILDADGGDIKFNDGGTHIGTLGNSSNDLFLFPIISNQDFKIFGNDGGSTITALTLDMSAAGAATFNSTVTATGLDISGDIDVDGTTNLDVVDIDGAVDMASTLTTAGDISINAGSGNPSLTIKTAGAGNNPHINYRAGDNTVFDTMLVASAATDYWRVGYGASGSVTSEFLAVTSAGNVGIGTTDPASALDVVTSSGDCVIRLGNGTSQARFAVDNDGPYIYPLTSGDTSLRVFTPTGSQALVIDSNGNALVGRTARLTGQSESISSDTVMSVHGVLASHQTNAGILQYASNTFTLRAYGASANTGEIAFNTGGGGGGADSEAMRIAADGSFSLSQGTGNNFRVIRDGDNTIEVGNYNATDGYRSTNYLSSTHTFFVASAGAGSGSRAVDIDTSGNLLVGCTDVPSASVPGFAVRDLSNGWIHTSYDSTNARTHHNFFNPNGSVGTIQTSGSSTLYNTSSDQRLKENIVDAPSASDDIDAIQVRSFDWKADGAHQKYGMVAQELQSVAPEAVSGDADSDEMMGVDYSKLVPMLVKEIQSLRARVQQLENN